MSERKTVLFRAPVLTQSGYGVHARQIFRWLLNKENVDLHVQALPWGNTPWIMDASSHDGLIGKVFERTSPPTKRPDVTIQLQLPNEWDPTLGDYNVGITAGVEADVCSDDWVDACNKMSRIIVPSCHTKKTFAAVKVPVSVVPEAFCDAVVSPSLVSVPKFDAIKTKFNFLIFGQLTSTAADSDRKNTFNAIKWICERFADDPDVGIVLKTNAGSNTRMDRMFVRNNVMKPLLAQVRKGANPKLYMLHGDMSDDEIAALYRAKSTKALVTLTRGEGFGLPILEAAASGLPVIATGWSGHMDFMGLGKFTEVSYSLAPVPPSRVDGKIFVNGSRWAEPSEADFKKKLARFRESPDVPREWAHALASKLRASHSFEAIASRYDEELKEIL